MATTSGCCKSALPGSSESLSLVHPMTWMSRKGGGCFVDSEHIDHRGPDEILLFYCCLVDIFIEDGQMVCRNLGRCSLSIETTLSSVSNPWDGSKINQ